MRPDRTPSIGRVVFRQERVEAFEPVLAVGLVRKAVPRACEEPPLAPGATADVRSWDPDLQIVPAP